MVVMNTAVTPYKEKLKHVSHRHHGIMLWLISNPDLPLKECARELGYTPAWLSCVIHSDAFKAEFAELKLQARDDVCMGLREKMTGIAHTAVDKLGDQIHATEDPAFLLSAADKMLSKLGYAPQTASVSINAQPGSAVGITAVSRETVEQAQLLRAKAIELKNVGDSGEIIDAQTKGDSEPDLG